MKTHLFYLFLAIYVITVALTLLGITGVLPIKDGYLMPLVTAFLIELAGAVVTIFRSADFFSSESDTRSRPSNENEIQSHAAEMNRIQKENAQLKQQILDVRTLPGIEIRFAHYGTGASQIDVTETVRRYVRDGTLNILVTSQVLCGGRDPAVGYVKGLTINYALAGRDRTIEVIEGSSLILP